MTAENGQYRINLKRRVTSALSDTVIFTGQLWIGTAFAMLVISTPVVTFIVRETAVSTLLSGGVQRRVLILAPFVEPAFNKLLPALVVLYYRGRSIGLIMGFLGGVSLLNPIESEVGWVSFVAGLAGAGLVALYLPRADSSFAKPPWTTFNIAATGGFVVGLTELWYKLQYWEFSWVMLTTIGLHTFTGGLVISAVLASPRSWYRTRRFWLSFGLATATHFAWNSALLCC